MYLSGSVNFIEKKINNYMNNDQLEELEALSYIFTENEMERDNSVLEFHLKECLDLKFQMVWPSNYPFSALIFSISDSRMGPDLKKAIENECNEFVRIK